MMAQSKSCTSVSVITDAVYTEYIKGWCTVMEHMGQRLPDKTYELLRKFTGQQPGLRGIMGKGRGLLPLREAVRQIRARHRGRIFTTPTTDKSDHLLLTQADLPLKLGMKVQHLFAVDDPANEYHKHWLTATVGKVNSSKGKAKSKPLTKLLRDHPLFKNPWAEPKGAQGSKDPWEENDPWKQGPDKKTN